MSDGQPYLITIGLDADTFLHMQQGARIAGEPLEEFVQAAAVNRASALVETVTVNPAARRIIRIDTSGIGPREDTG